MNQPVVFYNDAFLPQSEARLSLHDAGLVLGATVTDLCRTFAGRLYRWQDHLDRFCNSCRHAQVFPALALEAITARAEELVAHNVKLLPAGQDLCLVLLATPGPIGYYLGEAGGAGDGPATFIMHTFPLPAARYRKLLTDGAALVVPNVRQVPAQCIDPRAKQRSRLHWWLADREARGIEPGAMALLQDLDGNLCETAAANFLLVHKRQVVSPPQHTILPGVSLGVLQELCGTLGISFCEKPLRLCDCFAAEEALLTSTPYCLAPVSRIQGHQLPCPGPTFRRLRDAWNDAVGLDIHGQILQY